MPRDECNFCGEKGHFRRSCPHNPAADLDPPDLTYRGGRNLPYHQWQHRHERRSRYWKWDGQDWVWDPATEDWVLPAQGRQPPNRGRSRARSQGADRREPSAKRNFPAGAAPPPGDVRQEDDDNWFVLEKEDEKFFETRTCICSFWKRWAATRSRTTRITTTQQQPHQ